MIVQIKGIDMCEESIKIQLTTNDISYIDDFLNIITPEIETAPSKFHSLSRPILVLTVMCLFHFISI